VLADLALRPTRRRLLRNGLLAALILEGAIQNDRRAFWAMVILTAIVGFVVSPMQGWKRSLVRFLVVALPVAGLYIAAGWDSGSALFGPVRTLRGMLDTSQSRSSYWREVETWNIAMSTRESGLTGTGLGGQYTEIMENDDISDAYPEYREWPHNQVLGLLLLMGPFAFTGVWALLGMVFFLARRSFRIAADPEARLVAFGCMATVVACVVMAWSDLGLGFPQYKILAALAIAISARLAVETGAWPARPRPA